MLLKLKNQVTVNRLLINYLWARSSGLFQLEWVNELEVQLNAVVISWLE